jgi:VWFA-related protein
MLLRVAVLVIVLTACVGDLDAQDNDVDETIKVSTELVSVPVVVTDKDGHYVPDLRMAEFEVFQDGVSQPIEFFGASEEPVTVALLIDTSHSTRPVLDDIKDAARSFIKLLKPQDRAMIVSFDYETHILNPLTGDQETLKKAIKQAKIPDPIGTTLRDAIYETVFSQFKGITGRKALIVLTDGRDGGSHISARNLLTRLQQTDTLVYTVQFRTEERLRIERMLRTGKIDGGRRSSGDPQKGAERRAHQAELDARAQDLLQRLSLSTAGRFYESESGKLKKTFELIVDELRRQYRLGYYPPDNANDDAVHTIGVRVARPNLIVRSRLRYHRLSTAE